MWGNYVRKFFSFERNKFAPQMKKGAFIAHLSSDDLMRWNSLVQSQWKIDRFGRVFNFYSKIYLKKISAKMFYFKIRMYNVNSAKPGIHWNFTTYTPCVTIFFFSMLLQCTWATNTCETLCVWMPTPKPNGSHFYWAIDRVRLYWLPLRVYSTKLYCICVNGT